MDFAHLIGKPIRLKLKTGKTLTGWIQEPSNRSLFNVVVPFLPVDKQQMFQERFGGQDRVALPIHEVTPFIDFIDIQQIDSFELIENIVDSIYLLTEGGKKIEIVERLICRAGRRLPAVCSRIRPHDGEDGLDGAASLEGPARVYGDSIDETRLAGDAAKGFVRPSCFHLTLQEVI